MNENERKIVLNLVHSSIKKHKKLILIDDLINEDWTYKVIFWNIIENKKLLKEFDNLMFEDFKNRIKNKSTKMWKIIYDLYLKEKDLFEEFFKLNWNKDTKNKNFQEIGLKIQKLLLEWEESHVWRMEVGQFSSFSSSTSDKYWQYVKTFFPYYYLIWVKIK